MHFIKNTIKPIGVVITLLLSVMVTPAHAYIDPGAGSYIFQILIGGLMSALFVLRQFRTNLKNFFKQLLTKKDLNDDDTEVISKKDSE